MRGQEEEAPKGHAQLLGMQKAENEVRLRLTVDATMCNGCRRKGFKCISQESPEEGPLPLHGIDDCDTYHERVQAPRSEDDDRASAGISTPLSTTLDTSVTSQYLSLYKTTKLCTPIFYPYNWRRSVKFISIMMLRSPIDIRQFTARISTSNQNTRACLCFCKVCFLHENIRSEFAKPVANLLSSRMKSWPYRVQPSKRNGQKCQRVICFDSKATSSRETIYRLLVATFNLLVPQSPC